jgi:replicative DNA helicase
MLINQRPLHKNATRQDLLSTGYKILNNTLGHLQKGDLMIVAGRPGSYVQTFLTHMARRSATSYNQCTAYFTLRLYPEKEIVNRVLCQELEAKREDLDFYANEICEHYQSQLDKMADVIAATPLHIDTELDGDIATLCEQIKRYKRDYNIELIVLSNVAYLYDVRYVRPKKQEIQHCCKKLKRLALKLGIAIILGGGVKKQVDKQQDKTPTLDDIRYYKTLSTIVSHYIALHRYPFEIIELEDGRDPDDILEAHVFSQKNTYSILPFRINTTKGLVMDKLVW